MTTNQEKKDSRTVTVVLLGMFVTAFVFGVGALFTEGGWMHELRQLSVIDARYATCWAEAEAKLGRLGWVKVIEVDGETAWSAAQLTEDNSPIGFVRITCAYDGDSAEVKAVGDYNPPQ